jgi:hypothetical protein
MTPARKRLAAAALLTILAGQLGAMAASREVFPFSPYRMFSGRGDRPDDSFELCAVPESAGAEVPVVVDRGLAPLYRTHIQFTFRKMWDRGDEAALRGALGAILALYEKRRVEGRIDGPAARALRLYRRTPAGGVRPGDAAGESVRALVLEVPSERPTGSGAGGAR